jgi:hypothetical protein
MAEAYTRLRRNFVTEAEFIVVVSKGAVTCGLPAHWRPSEFK